MSLTSSPTVHKLSMRWVLCAHGMCDLALQTIFRSVIIAKLLYASSAWWGFINAIDRQPVNAFLNSSIRCDLCPPDLRSFEELCRAADVQRFDKVLGNTNHVIYSLLPPPSVASQNYNLRHRTHNGHFILHTGHLTDCNFLTLALFTNIY